MLHSYNPEILFLKQEDVIKAGLLNMKQIIEIVEETYTMLGKGQIKNPPKTSTKIPQEENWQSFFNSMPCYIAGDYHIAGVKWAAESKKNYTVPGIPMGIDITILSDPDTVLPYCILDGTLVTAMRTSAVGAILAKYAAPSGTDTATLVGAGVIGRTMVEAIHLTMPELKTIYLFDIDPSKAEGIASEYGDGLGVKIIPTSDGKAAALKSGITVAQTTSVSPVIRKDWLAPGCGFVTMNPFEVADDAYLAADHLAVDYWTQLKEHVNPIVKLVGRGAIKEEEIIDLSELILGEKKLRSDDSEIAAAGSYGLGSLDIMIGHRLYLNASEMGIGQKLKLWDKPLWV